MAALEQISFVVDENLLGLGRALVHLRNDVALLGEAPVAEMLPSGIHDSDWIPVVGARRWTMITNDARIRTRPAEASLAEGHRLRVIHLDGNVGNQRPWDQAVRLLSRWDAVETLLYTTRTDPLWISVRATKVLAMGYDPGGFERV